MVVPITSTLPQGEVVLQARPGEDTLLVEARVQRTEGEGGYANDLSYRAITWPEVQALCRAEDVELQHDEQTATLSFPVLE